MAVKTKHVQRRSLEFADYDQLLEEVRRLSSAPTRQLGNWTLGQICEHVSKAMDMAIDGAPFKAPFFIRWVGPYFKKRVMAQPMTPGFQLPKIARPLLPTNVEDAAGVAMVERSVARLRGTSQRQPHFAFGPMTREEWDHLHLKHAAMHLSFIELA